MAFVPRVFPWHQPHPARLTAAVNVTLSYLKFFISLPSDKNVLWSRAHHVQCGTRGATEEAKEFIPLSWGQAMQQQRVLPAQPRMRVVGDGHDWARVWPSQPVWPLYKGADKHQVSEPKSQPRSGSGEGQASRHHPACGAAKDGPWLGPYLPLVSKLWFTLNKVVHQMKDAACCSHISLWLSFREYRAFSTETRQVDLGACPREWAPPPPAPAGSWERARGAGLLQMKLTPRSVRATLQTLRLAASPPQLLRAQGLCLCALSPSPSWLLGLEIRELLLISCWPRTWPRTRGAPLSILLTGEMTKPGVTFTLQLSLGQPAQAALGWGFCLKASQHTNLCQPGCIADICRSWSLVPCTYTLSDADGKRKRCGCVCACVCKRRRGKSLSALSELTSWRHLTLTETPTPTPKPTAHAQISWSSL